MTIKEQIWHDLMAEINNEIGVAGLMGNLQAESGLIPYRVQGDFSSGYTYSINYTSQVDSGAISEYNFVNNGPNGGGYGLAQWTFHTRKQAMYNMMQQMGVSIGDTNLAITFLLHELNTDFSGVMTTLKVATTIRQASDKVLHDFENPADQSEEVEILRASLGSTIYEELTGSVPPTEPSKKRKMPLWMYLRWL